MGLLDWLAQIWRQLTGSADATHRGRGYDHDGSNPQMPDVYEDGDGGGDGF